MNKFLKSDIENIIKETPDLDLSIIIYQNKETESSTNNDVEYINFGNATQKSFFPIASLTKPIVSIAFLGLLNENKIDINRKISEFEINFLNKNFKNLTIKHLLTHRSGIKNSGKLFYNNTLNNYLTEITSSIPVSETGDFSYSNNNYNLIRFIIENITKSSFEDFMNTFFKKLGMNSSFFNLSKESEAYQSNNIIKGHLYDLDENLIEIDKYPDNPINAPSFNLISTPEDMKNFISYLFKDSKLSLNTLIKKQTIFESATTLSFNYENTEDGYFLDHNGLLAIGFQSYIRIIPDKDIAFCILANDLTIDINLISDIITQNITSGEYKHKFNTPLNNIIPQVILENIKTGFYKGYETGIIELFIEENELCLNMFEHNYEIKYYNGNKFYHYNNGFLIEMIIDFENNKLYLNGESLIKTKKPEFINKSKVARKLKGIYKHKEDILPDIEIFTEYNQENIMIFLIDSIDEFEIFILDSENEVILPDYGHLILSYNENEQIVNFELDGFEEYIKI